MPAEQSTERVKRWKLRGRVTGAPGPLSHLVVEVLAGPPLAEHETVEVIPADAPNVLSVEEARLLWKYATTHNIASDRILNRLRTFAEEADRD